MSKRPISMWTKIHRWFMRFNLCRCPEPKFEVLKGVLSCSVCGKAAKWER